MNFINYSNVSSTVSFSELRLNQKEVATVIRQNSQGLSHSEILDQNLAQGNYIPVLSAIWGEKDKLRRLDWLRSQEHQLHAPLMFEQAIAEFTNSPTAETVATISLPLIRAAAFRVHQDAQCSRDASVYNGDASPRMQNTYVMALQNAIKKYAPSLRLEKIQEEKRDEMQVEIKKKLREIVEKTLSAPNTLPDPTWIGYHSIMSVFGEAPQMHPREEFDKKRQEMVQSIMPQLN